VPGGEVAADAVRFIAFAPDGRLLIARNSGRIEFVDIATGQRQTIDMKLPSPRAVELAPAGDRVAVANADGVAIWHLASSSKTTIAAGDDVTALTFARGGQLTTGHASGEIKIWDPPSWTNVVTLRPGVGAVTNIGQASAGHVAAIGASGGGVAVCDAGDRQVKQRLGADRAWRSIAIAPDNRTLAAAGADGVALWDTILWQTRAAPGGHEPATHVVFWRDGRVLVTAGAEGAIRIHDLATRQLLKTLRNDKSPIVSLDLADDGRTIATTDAAGIFIWDSTTGAMRKLQ
jgi:WD40 repeat protein